MKVPKLGWLPPKGYARGRLGVARPMAPFPAHARTAFHLRRPSAPPPAVGPLAHSVSATPRGRYTLIVRSKSSLFSQRVRFVERSSGCVRPMLSVARETNRCSPAGSAGISSVKNVHV